MKIAAFVPMRHDSVRIPGKNYREIAGKPLYFYILETLQQVPEITDIVVDTDSPIIIEGIAKNFPKIKTITRPPELRAGDVPMNEVLIYDTGTIEADYYLQTHSTNPLLKASTISSGIKAFLSKTYAYDSMFSVTRVTKRFWDQLTRPVNHNPAIMLRTQDIPPIYEENSCMFLFSRDVLLNKRTRIGDRPLMFEMDALEAQDIDDETEWKVAEMLLLLQQKGELWH